jgi:hypothetical protein
MRRKGSLSVLPDPGPLIALLLLAKLRFFSNSVAEIFGRNKNAKELIMLAQ